MGKVEEMVRDYGLEWFNLYSPDRITEQLETTAQQVKSAQELWGSVMSGNLFELTDMEKFVVKTGGNPRLTSTAKTLEETFYSFYYNGVTHKYEYEANVVKTAMDIVIDEELLGELKPEYKLTEIFAPSSQNKYNYLNQIEREWMGILTSVNPGIKKLNTELFEQVEQIYEKAR